MTAETGWYPVLRGVDLGRPRQVRLLGRRLVVFRAADGAPRVLTDRCLHRGGELHRGIVTGDCIECPYHGWKFRGTDGRCVHVPGRTAAIPTSAAIRVFPAVELHGLVWTHISD